MKELKNGKETEIKRKLTEHETEKVTGGITIIFRTGEPVAPNVPDLDEPRDGGAAGGW